MNKHNVTPVAINVFAALIFLLTLLILAAGSSYVQAGTLKPPLEERAAYAPLNPSLNINS